MIIPNGIFQLLDEDDCRFSGAVELHFCVRPRGLFLPTSDVGLDGGKAARNLGQLLLETFCVTEEVARERAEVSAGDGAEDLLQTDIVEIVRSADSADKVEWADAKDVVADLKQDISRDPCIENRIMAFIFSEGSAPFVKIVELPSMN